MERQEANLAKAKKSKKPESQAKRSGIRRSGRELMRNVRERAQARQDFKGIERMLTEAFYDIYHNRGRIYRVNFVRGIFFGLGASLGGSIVIALVVAIVIFLKNILPFMSDFFDWVIQILQK